MTAAQNGDREAYHRLLLELGSVIERYLRRHFGSLPFEEDCVQDALMNLHKARHTWSPGRAFGPWLFTIVRHTAIDAIRHSERYRSALDTYADHRKLSEHSADSNASAEVGELLSALNTQQRDVLLLMKLQGLTAREAGSRLGISSTAAKVRCHRALKRLQNLASAQRSNALTYDESPDPVAAMT